MHENSQNSEINKGIIHLYLLKCNFIDFLAINSKIFDDEINMFNASFLEF